MEENNFSETPERNKFITFWLWLMIIAGTISSLSTAYTLFTKGVPVWTYSGIFYYTAANNGFVLTMACATLIFLAIELFGLFKLLNWKKSGFWIVVLTQVISLIVSWVCLNGIGTVETATMLGQIGGVCIGMGIFYAILCLKKNGIRYWDALS